MKKILTLGFLALFLVGIVTAADPTGFFVGKHVAVTGDWQWDGDSWENGDFTTTTFGYGVASPDATSGFFVQTEGLGTPWKYDLEMGMTSNADTITYTELDIWTVNDPATTPATGGYTAYGFFERNEGEYSVSELTVNGFGEAFINSNVMFDGYAKQFTAIDIN